MHKRILDKIGQRGWKAAHLARTLVWRIFKPQLHGVAGIIMNSCGDVLLVKASYLDKWHFPGGGIEKQEHPASALAREIEEEVGLSIKDPVEIEIFTHHLYGAQNTVHLYLVQHWSGNVVIDGTEITAFLWVTPTTLPDEMTQPTRRGFASLQRIAYP